MAGPFHVNGTGLGRGQIPGSHGGFKGMGKAVGKQFANHQASIVAVPAVGIIVAVMRRQKSPTCWPPPQSP